MPNNLRGDHTSLIPLAIQIINNLESESKKENKKFTYSPGYITQKNMKVKQLSITVLEEKNSILIQVLMKGSKQFVRIYDLSAINFVKYTEQLCKDMQITVKLRK